MPTLEIPGIWIEQQGYVLQSRVDTLIADKDGQIADLKDQLQKAQDEARLNRRFADATLKSQRDQALELAAVKEKLGEPLPDPVAEAPASALEPAKSVSSR